MALGFEAFEEHTKEAKFDDLARTVEQAKQEAEQLAGIKEELKKLVAYIDLTTLAGDDTRARVQKLAQRVLRTLQRISNIKGRPRKGQRPRLRPSSRNDPVLCSKAPTPVDTPERLEFGIPFTFIRLFSF